ncbi:cell division protein FtsQ/DivIB [Saccharicrinis sp. FJH65]|uniref:cell division protein FtsQ/DivIB n=1 Tax=Saccharicrinis sp. FJH65 TaxID=3344659 RepID=UPI0036D330D1
MRKVRNILLVVIPLLYIVVSMGFVSENSHKLICTKIEVTVLDSLTNTFIDPDDVLMMLNNEGIKLEGRRMNDINAQEVEDYIDKHPSILKSECYKTIGGTFRIDVHQRRPLIRVLTNKSNYYIDSNGDIMPFSKHYTAFVPVATGNVNDDNIKHGLFALGKFLDESEFWRAQISQINVVDDRDVTIIPRVGNHEIEFGSLDNIEEKFARLEALYKTKFNTEGWNRYKKISVKFENQVVCTKK